MKVGELTDKLNGLDRNMQVVCWCEDDVEKTMSFIVEDVSANDARLWRDENTREPRITFEKGDESVKIAVLCITGTY